MGEQQLLKRIDEISQFLYQNKTNQIWNEVKKILQELQKMVTEITGISDEVTAFSIEMLKELVDNYQNQDIIGLADCLQEKVTIFIQFYFEQKNIR